MANESIIAVPPELRDLKSVQLFLARLVTVLDVVIGKRGATPAASSADLTAQVNALAQSIAVMTLSLQAFATSAANTAETNANTYTDNAIDALEQPPIADLNYTALIMSAGYVQAEAQQLATDIQTVADKVDDLLAMLRTAGILGV